MSKNQFICLAVNTNKKTGELYSVFNRIVEYTKDGSTNTFVDTKSKGIFVNGKHPIGAIKTITTTVS